MTIEDPNFAKKIATYLDHGAAGLKAGTVYKLQLARNAAVERLADPARAREPRLALAGAGTTGGGHGTRAGFRYALGILVFVAGIFGYQQWQAYQQLRDIEETDAAILSSDLPIDAYLDRGFQNWLKHTSDDDD